MSKLPLISAIMPVFKTPEATLRKSIESILSQTEHNFQLVIVDDGCPNESGAICDEYVTDERVLVIHQKNAGPSAARNAGLSVAQGGFLTFIDADDVLAPNAWELILRAFEHTAADCIVFGWNDFSSEGISSTHPVTTHERILSANEVLHGIASDNFSFGGGFPWNKVWRINKILEKGSLPRFDEKLFTYEDKLWTLEMLSKIDTVALLPDIFYCYRIEGTSLTHNETDWSKRQFNAYEAYEKIAAFLRTVNKKAYIGAMQFYFQFSLKDTFIRRKDRWRSEELYQRTKSHLHDVISQLGFFASSRYFFAWLFSFLFVRSSSFERHGGKHNVYFDVLNTLASFFVVWIHFGNVVHWYDGSSVWKMCVPIQVLSYWAVPVFFMLSGASLMGYRNRCTTAEFFRRRIARTVIPYLFWGTLAILWMIHRQTLVLDSGIMLHIINVFLNGSMGIYWFFIPLFGLYLAMPLFSLLADERYRRILHYVVIVGILTVCVLPYFYNLFHIIIGKSFFWNGNMRISCLAGYSVYAVLGYLASIHSFTKKQRVAIYANGVFCIAIGLLSFYVLTPTLGLQQIFFDYFNYPHMGLALAVFVFIRYFTEKFIKNDEMWSLLFKKLASCSFGVFLCHLFLLQFMEVRPFFAKYSVQWYFFWPVVCYLACVLSVAFIKKIPVIKKLV